MDNLNPQKIGEVCSSLDLLSWYSSNNLYRKGLSPNQLAFLTAEQDKIFFFEEPDQEDQRYAASHFLGASLLSSAHQSSLIPTIPESKRYIGLGQFSDFTRVPMLQLLGLKSPHGQIVKKINLNGGDPNYYIPTEDVVYVKSSLVEDMRLQARLESESRVYSWKGDFASEHELIQKYFSFVKFIAGQMARFLPSHIEFDELVEFGVFGLIDAIKKYNPKMNVKFKTYALHRIRGAILDERRALDWAPRTVRSRRRHIEELINNAPEVDYIMLEKELNLPREKIERILSNETMILSLDEIISGRENTAEHHCFIPDSTVDLGDQVQKHETEKLVQEVLAEMPDRYRKILVLMHVENLTEKEIAQIMGVTDSRISQLYSQASKIFKTKLLKKGFQHN